MILSGDKYLNLPFAFNRLCFNGVLKPLQGERSHKFWYLSFNYHLRNSFACDSAQYDADTTMTNCECDIFPTWRWTQYRLIIRRPGAQTCPHLIDRAIFECRGKPDSRAQQPCDSASRELFVKAYLFFRCAHNHCISTFRGKIGSFTKNDLMQGW